ncbi:MAG TPA: hypothetical protein VJG32_17700 [Anaerolineae bacterium]|nr:hypothetical protein [Anaerolineae bacterium]
MDTWYAIKDVRLSIGRVGKVFYCPLKDNRPVDDSAGTRPYRRVDRLAWTADERAHGQTVKIKDFPKTYKVKLFRVVLSTQRTIYQVKHDLLSDYLRQQLRSPAVSTLLA